MKRYYYVCPHCEHSVELTAPQAGQEMACPACQTDFVAPKLGTLRQLPPVGEPEAPSRSGGSGRQRFLFAAGLILFLLMGGAGIGLHWYGSSMMHGDHVETEIKQLEDRLDQMSAPDLLMSYDQMDLDKGLGPWEEHRYRHDQKQGKYLKGIAYGFLALASLGLLMVIWSFWQRSSTTDDAL